MASARAPDRAAQTVSSYQSVWNAHTSASGFDMHRITDPGRTPCCATSCRADIRDSLMTQVLGSIAAHTCSGTPTARPMTAGSHGLSAQKCCGASYSSTQPRRRPAAATIGSRDLPAPASMKPARYRCALRLCSEGTKPDATSAKCASQSTAAVTSQVSAAESWWPLCRPGTARRARQPTSPTR